MSALLFDNLRNFSLRFPELGERLSKQRPGTIQAAATKDGGYCYVKQAGDKWQTLSEAENPQLKAQQAINSMQDRLGSGYAPIVVIGLNPGYILDSIYHFVKKSYYDKHIPRRIYVVVNSIECLYGWLKQTDRSEIIAQDAIEFYWHQDVNKITKLCEEDYTRSHLFVPISSLPEQQSMSLIAPLAEIFLKRQAEEEELFISNNTYYDAMIDEDLDKVLSGEGQRKPRLLVPSHGSSTVVQYSVRDTKVAFEEAGWEVQIIHMKTDLSRWRIQKTIDEFKPDVYMMVNHLRTQEGKYYPENLMFITWIQDTLASINNTKAAEKWNEHVNNKANRRDLIIGYVGQIKQYGYREDRLEECPMIVNSNIFKPRELTEEELEKYSCDVCFASNRSTPTDVVARNLAGTLGKYGFDEDVMMQIHDHLCEWYRAENTCTNYQNLKNKISEISVVDKIFKQINHIDDIKFIIERIFWELNDIIYRHVVLEWLDELGNIKLHLYGRGWDKHPRFSKYAKGVISHGENLTKAYSASNYCLHLNSKEGDHQRINEINGCSSTVLSRQAAKITKHTLNLPKETVEKLNEFLFKNKEVNFTETEKENIIYCLCILSQKINIQLLNSRLIEELKNYQSDKKMVSFLSKKSLIEKFKKSILLEGKTSKPCTNNEFIVCLVSNVLSESAALNKLNSIFNDDIKNYVKVGVKILSLTKTVEAKINPKSLLEEVNKWPKQAISFKLKLCCYYEQTGNPETADKIWEGSSIQEITNSTQLSLYILWQERRKEGAGKSFIVNNDHLLKHISLCETAYCLYKENEFGLAEFIFKRDYSNLSKSVERSIAYIEVLLEKCDIDECIQFCQVLYKETRAIGIHSLIANRILGPFAIYLFKECINYSEKRNKAIKGIGVLLKSDQEKDNGNDITFITDIYYSYFCDDLSGAMKKLESIKALNERSYFFSSFFFWRAGEIVIVKKILKESKIYINSGKPNIHIFYFIILALIGDFKKSQEVLRGIQEKNGEALKWPNNNFLYFTALAFKKLGYETIAHHTYVEAQSYDYTCYKRMKHLWNKI